MGTSGPLRLRDPRDAAGVAHVVPDGPRVRRDAPGDPGGRSAVTYLIGAGRTWWGQVPRA